MNKEEKRISKKPEVLLVIILNQHVMGEGRYLIITPSWDWNFRVINERISEKQIGCQNLRASQIRG